MKAVLHVTSGALSGRRVRLDVDHTLRVGRLGRADIVVSQDEQMAPVHFDLTWDGVDCRLTDRSRRGTKVNGQSATDVTLADGALIAAGHTQFLLRLVPDTLGSDIPKTVPPAALSPTLRAARIAALDALQNEPQLFAILDAARDRRILSLLCACEDESRSLFDGPQGEVMARAAPYLVRLAKGSQLLPILVDEGWGDSWGIYLTSARPLREIRQRIRRSLMVKDEETGKQLFFRFYDPRVLRVFWPTCSARQRSEILGTEIGGFLFEGADAEIIRTDIARV